mmetsp:Transcript_34044/g.82708  ORF Transcript_34044/g.82708 Transcript_34044/m.82708 type:complete len:221 (-) Transcript_34044:2246-2908(-)
MAAAAALPLGGELRAPLPQVRHREPRDAHRRPRLLRRRQAVRRARRLRLPRRPPPPHARIHAARRALRLPQGALLRQHDEARRARTGAARHAAAVGRGALLRSAQPRPSAALLAGGAVPPLAAAAAVRGRPRPRDALSHGGVAAAVAPAALPHEAAPVHLAPAGARVGGLAPLSPQVQGVGRHSVRRRVPRLVGLRPLRSAGGADRAWRGGGRRDHAVRL